MAEPYKVERYHSEEAWLENRIAVTGTVISSAMNRHPHHSGLKSWQRLTGNDPDPFTGNYKTRRGSALEPVVAEEAMDMIGMKFEPCQWTIFRSVDAEWEAVTPDYVNFDEEIGMEIKTSGSKMGHLYGAGPLDYQVDQCQWAMAITGWKLWYLVVAVDDDEPRIFPIDRDEEWIKSARQAAHDFWHDHVLPEVPPPADDSDDYKAYLEALHPHGEGQVDCRINGGDKELSALLREYSGFKDAENLAKKQVRLVSNRIREILGDTKKAITSAGTVSWHDRAPALPWKTVAEQLRAHVGDEVWRKTLDEAKKNTRVSRVLRVTYNGQ